MKKESNNIFFFKPQIVWDLKSQSPELFHHVTESNNWVYDSYKGLLKRFPSTKNNQLFAKDGFIRLKDHIRAFYMIDSDNKVLGIKGTEPTNEVLEEQLKRMSRRYVSHFGSLLETFILKEQKAPMALLESEALLEAKRALEFQRAYLLRFGKIARVPVPLMIGRLPKRMKENYWQLLSPLLTERSEELLNTILKNDSLAFYAYYYPSIPTRASHTSLNLSGQDLYDYKKRQKHLTLMNKLFHKDFDFFSVLDRWCELIVDMLELGYFPSSLSDRFSGSCVQRQNCVMDGGFADIGSLCPMSEIKEDYLFQETFFMLLSSFSNTVEKLFFGNVEEKSKRYMPISSLVNDCTLKEIMGKVDQRITNGVSFDTRLINLLNSIKSFKGLDSLFCNTFSPDNHRS